MSEEHKQRLHDYLTTSREAVIWKVEGLSEYDARRPLTRTGTNLLGLIKHLSVGEAWYFGRVFDRPFEPQLPWWDDDAAEGDDMWVASYEDRQNLVETYRAVIAHADQTISSLDLDAPGHVPWWPRPHVTLHAVLVHVLSETSRHAGHADILREQVDGRTGMRADHLNQERHDDQWWANTDHVSRPPRAGRSHGTQGVTDRAVRRSGGGGSGRPAARESGVVSTSGSDLVEGPHGVPVAHTVPAPRSAEVGTVEALGQSAAAAMSPLEEADD